MREVKKEDLYNKYIVVVSNSNGHNYPIGKPLQVKIHTSRFLKENSTTTSEINIFGTNNNQIVKRDIRVLTNKSEIESLIILNNSSKITNPDKIVGYCWFDSKGKKVAYNKNGSDIFIYTGLRSIQIRHRFTGNCQMFAYSGFNTLIAGIRDRTLTEKEFYNYLLNVYYIAAQQIMFVDVNSMYVPTIEKLFGKNVMLKSPYVSTNNSQMCLMLINIYRYLSPVKSAPTFTKIACKDINKLIDFSITRESHY